MQRSASNVSTSTALIFSYIGMVLLLTIVSWAQTPTGTISGTVVDQSGAVVSKVEITVRNKATGIERKVTSSESGIFSVPSLGAGEYVVTATLQGFRTHVQEVTITTGSIVKVDIQMEIGQTTETVTVEAAGVAQIVCPGPLRAETEACLRTAGSESSAWRCNASCRRWFCIRSRRSDCRIHGLPRPHQSLDP